MTDSGYYLGLLISRLFTLPTAVSQGSRVHYSHRGPRSSSDLYLGNTLEKNNSTTNI